MTLLQRLLAALAVALAAAPAAAASDGFPSRPVTMIVPYAAGGSADVLGRVLAQQMAEDLGQNVVVELKPGAGGNLGAEQVARQAKPDGYTVLLASISLATSVSLQKLPFDPRKDLAPVAGIAQIPSLLVVSSEAPYRTLGDLVAAAKAKPGAINYGSSGPATGSHLAGELLAARAGVELTHVPYRGSGAVYPDLVAQRISFLIDVMGSSSVQVRGGRVRPLAITSAARSRAFPEVPTFAESGFPGYEFQTWFGLFVPAGTPREAVARLEQATLKALQTPEMRQRLTEASAEPIAGPAAEFARYYATDVERWARLVREGRVQPVSQ